MITLCLAYILGQAARAKDLAINVYQIVIYLCITLSLDIGVCFIIADQIIGHYL